MEPALGMSTGTAVAFQRLAWRFIRHRCNHDLRERPCGGGHGGQELKMSSVVGNARHECMPWSYPVTGETMTIVSDHAVGALRTATKLTGVVGSA